MLRKMMIMLSIAFVTLLGAACQPPTPPQPPGPPVPPVGMANPAAVYCAEQGYKSDIRTASDGSQAGFCVFPDGTECDEWAFLRGECGQDKSFCAKHQGKLQKGDGGATCTFADGSSCPEYDFFAGTCKPGAK